MALITHFHLTGVIFIPTNNATAINEYTCDPVCKTSLADAVVLGCSVNANSLREVQQPSWLWLYLCKNHQCRFDSQTSSCCWWCCIYHAFSKKGPAPALTRRKTSCLSFRRGRWAPQAAQLCHVSRRDLLLSCFTVHLLHQNWIFFLRRGISKAWCHKTVCPTCSASRAWRSLDHPRVTDDKGKGKPAQSAGIINSWFTETTHKNVYLVRTDSFDGSFWAEAAFPSVHTAVRNVWHLRWGTGQWLDWLWRRPAPALVSILQKELKKKEEIKKRGMGMNQTAAKVLPGMRNRASVDCFARRMGLMQSLLTVTSCASM